MGGRSPCSVRPVAAPSSDLPCPPGCPTSGRRGADRGGRGPAPGRRARWPASPLFRDSPRRAPGQVTAEPRPAVRDDDRAQAQTDFPFPNPAAGSRTMSAPNKNYDPVEVTSLSPAEVARMRDEALAAVAAATTLDEP